MPALSLSSAFVPAPTFAEKRDDPEMQNNAGQHDDPETDHWRIVHNSARELPR